MTTPTEWNLTDGISFINFYHNNGPSPYTNDPFNMSGKNIGIRYHNNKISVRKSENFMNDSQVYFYQFLFDGLIISSSKNGYNVYNDNIVAKDVFTTNDIIEITNKWTEIAIANGLLNTNSKEALTFKINNEQKNIIDEDIFYFVGRK